MAVGVVLRLVTLWSVLTVTRATMKVSGCSNAFIRLQCNKDEALIVSEISLEKDTKGMCPEMSSGTYPPVPSAMNHLCNQASECLFEKDVCNDKNDCVFFVGGQQRLDNAVVSIDYGCVAGSSRIGGVVGFILVAAALGITMFTLVFMLVRRSTSPEDDSKYVEFENRLSRSGSVGSEISAKREANARIKNMEEEGGAGALPQKNTQF